MTPNGAGAAGEVTLIVQARTSSRRLPGKVLLPLAGRPAIVRMMERVARSRRAKLRRVATSTDPSDDALVEACESHGIEVVRGPLDDVLARFVAAVPESSVAVVRLTGDCPLIDPALVDAHVEAFFGAGRDADYVTNAVVRTQPDGLDVEVVSRERLLEANRHAADPLDREHVLPWVRRHATLYAVTQPVDLSALRWTLDTRADYDVIAAVYDALYPEDPAFSSMDIYRLLIERPELIHVAGKDELTQAERATWVRRIEEHLASAGGA